jgi:hypothetical protein
MFFSQYGPHPDPGRALDDAERQLGYYDAFLRKRYVEGQGIEDTIRDLAFDIFKTEADLDWAARATLRSFVLGYQSYFARPPLT